MWAYEHNMRMMKKKDGNQKTWYILCLSQFTQPTNRAKVKIRIKVCHRKIQKKKAYLRTVAAAVVETVHAPPAMTFLHAPQFQIPTAVLLTESCFIPLTLAYTSKIDHNRTLPQNVQVYRACCEISIFLTCLRREAP